MAPHGDIGSETSTKIRLVVLFGGQSAEHDVSCVTAQHVIAAADQERYDVVGVGITRGGEWVSIGELSATTPLALEAVGPAVDPTEAVATTGDAATTTVVIPLLHGPLGEDGTVQGMLELAGVPYVGSGVLASAVAMDKLMAKEVLAQAGIAQAIHIGVRADDPNAPSPGALAETLGGYPVFVKPANMGSSIGVSKARSDDELAAALTLAHSYDEWAVVEEAIVGRELEIAVLGNTDLITSAPGEIVPGTDFYDYADKYHDGNASTVVGAELPPGVAEEMADIARRSFVALRCSGMARVDCFYEADGRGLLLNEVNTIPGFTPISMFPKMMEHAGIGYSDLIDRLVDLALDRASRTRRRTDV